MASATKFRTHTCGELRAADAKKEVSVAGFVHRLIDEKAGLAIELRDSAGRTRVVMPPKPSPELVKTWSSLKLEDVIRVSGMCNARPQADPEMETGAVEVAAKTVEVMSISEMLPPAFQMVEPPLDDRLRFRYLDLRRPIMQKRLQFRAKFLTEMRTYLAAQGFTEIDTPTLSTWTPEQTASFIVPGMQAGRCFALPGTPQAYKQMLMVGGVDRYFQIARCYRREEDLTPERQLEFSVLDIEMAWADEEDIWSVVDGLLAHLWKTCVGAELKAPPVRIPHEEALTKYGSDKPDLRNPLRISDLTALARNTATPPLSEISFRGGAVRAIRIPRTAQVKDADLDALQALFKHMGESTITWSRIDKGPKQVGPGSSLFGGTLEGEFTRITVAGVGDVVVIVLANHPTTASQIAGAVRQHLSKKLGLAQEGHQLCWVTQFPFYAYDSNNEVYGPDRHPFTQPRTEDLGLMAESKHSVRTKAFDLVLNGVELGAGSVRNHDVELQRKIFEMFEYKPEDVERRFGKVLDAFRFGVPPHGGMSIGLDRLLALLQGTDAIGEVIAFPKSSEGKDLMFESPSAVDKDLVRAMCEP